MITMHFHTSDGRLLCGLPALPHKHDAYHVSSAPWALRNDDLELGAFHVCPDCGLLVALPGVTPMVERNGIHYLTGVVRRVA